MLRIKERKLIPFLIQDFGIYCGNGIERSFPNNMDSKIGNNETIKDGKSLVLEYLEITKEIKKLENKKSISAKKINGNAELQKIFKELSNENSHKKIK